MDYSLYFKELHFVFCFFLKFQLKIYKFLLQRHIILWPRKITNLFRFPHRLLFLTQLFQRFYWFLFRFFYIFFFCSCIFSVKRRCIEYAKAVFLLLWKCITKLWLAICFCSFPFFYVNFSCSNIVQSHVFREFSLRKNQQTKVIGSEFSN